MINKVIYSLWSIWPQQRLCATQYLPFELGSQVLGQSLGEALSSDAVVCVGVENLKHSSVDLQHRHAQRRPTQLKHQDVAVNTVQSISREDWVGIKLLSCH